MLITIVNIIIIIIIVINVVIYFNLQDYIFEPNLLFYQLHPKISFPIHHLAK